MLKLCFGEEGLFSGLRSETIYLFLFPEDYIISKSKHSILINLIRFIVKLPLLSVILYYQKIEVHIWPELLCTKTKLIILVILEQVAYFAFKKIPLSKRSANKMM